MSENEGEWFVRSYIGDDSLPIFCHMPFLVPRRQQISGNTEGKQKKINQTWKMCEFDSRDALLYWSLLTFYSMIVFLSAKRIRLADEIIQIKISNQRSRLSLSEEWGRSEGQEVRKEAEKNNNTVIKLKGQSRSGWVAQRSRNLFRCAFSAELDPRIPPEIHAAAPTRDRDVWALLCTHKTFAHAHKTQKCNVLIRISPTVNTFQHITK